jgi:hypothetical protein
MPFEKFLLSHKTAFFKRESFHDVAPSNVVFKPLELSVAACCIKAFMLHISIVTLHQKTAPEMGLAISLL